MKGPEKIKFNAEVDKVLHLMIHSLYTNKDTFLRELVSNAADACDRLKFEANAKSDIELNQPFKIKIAIDKAKEELSIEDNGIGMTRQELIDNLGTIASSGTQKFLQKLKDQPGKETQLIGQFGVGFYSAFMVAEEVIVISKKINKKEVWQWSSKGDGEFTLSKPDRPFDSAHGTIVILKLREDAREYLERFRITNIINTYSDHISVPIEFVSDKPEESSTINSSSALWMRSKSDVKESEYTDFYHKVALSADSPWMILHNRNEGAVEYTNLLFIPSSKPFDLFHPDRKRRVKLYIKRVFINDEGVDLVPHYMRFLKGVVDSADLPLNISREVLQHNKVIEKIKQSITNRVLSELGKKLDICLFKSSKLDKLITLDEYVKNMKSGQNVIYYISGDDGINLANHPQLEGFKAKGIDVLLFTDTVDTFWVNVLHKYKDMELKSVTRSNIDLDQIEPGTETQQESDKTEAAALSEEDKNKVVQYFKDTLKDVVKDVRVSKKLKSTPVCLVVDEGAMDIRMEKFLVEQKQLKSGSLKILEINVESPIINSLLAKIKSSSTNSFTETVVHLLFEEACIVEGQPVSDPQSFASRMNEMLVRACG
jgi:molecular chaperone HtpG